MTLMQPYRLSAKSRENFCETASLHFPVTRERDIEASQQREKVTLTNQGARSWLLCRLYEHQGKQNLNAQEAR